MMNAFSPVKEHPLPEKIVLLEGDEPEEKAREALKKGLAVVWPVSARTSPEALRTLAERHQGKIFPFAPLLETPRVLHLEKTLRSGQIGEIGIATHRRTSSRLDAFSLALNDVVLLRRFLGEAFQVFATRVTSETTDFLTVCLALKSGGIANVISHADKSFSPRFAFDYAGQKGNLLHDGNEDISTIGGQPQPQFQSSPDEVRGLKTAWANLLRCFAEGSGPFYPVEEWLEDLEIIGAVQKSAKTFTPQELPSREARP